MPCFPDSVAGLNWSAPKAKLQGLMPPAPRTRNPNPLSRKANWQAVGSTHVPLCFASHFGGCNLEIAAVRVSTVIPLKMKKRLKKFSIRHIFPI